MMDDSVHDGYRHVTVKEELSPVGKFLVRRQDDGPVFIHGVNQLKQVVHALFVHWQVAEFINDY
jgi:hypothetical protein